MNLLYGDYEKMTLIPKIMSESFDSNLKPNGITFLTTFKHFVLPMKRIDHYGFGTVTSNVSSSISSILLHYNRLNLSKVILF